MSENVVVPQGTTRKILVAVLQGEPLTPQDLTVVGTVVIMDVKRSKNADEAIIRKSTEADPGGIEVIEPTTVAATVTVSGTPTARDIQPADMNGITEGSLLLLANGDGSADELVTVESVTDSTFNAVVTLSKTENWVVTTGKVRITIEPEDTASLKHYPQTLVADVRYKNDAEEIYRTIPEEGEFTISVVPGISSFD